jgi:hypothetical protein
MQRRHRSVRALQRISASLSLQTASRKKDSWMERVDDGCFGLIIGRNRVKPCWLFLGSRGYEPIYPIPLTDHNREGESNSNISILMYVDNLHLLGRCSERRSQNEQFELQLLQASRAEDAFVTHSGKENIA